MNRKNAIKSIIALAIAPALIKVEMLMPAKTIVKPFIGELGYYAGFTIFDYKKLMEMKKRMQEQRIQEPCSFIVHPNLYKELKGNRFIENEFILKSQYIPTLDNMKEIDLGDK